jgi:formylglycine-generating enzyme required for sulfatase activity
MKNLFMVVMVIVLATPAIAQDRGVALQPKSASPSTPERMTALVIGNSTYLSSPLKNPANDARVMALALRDRGFSVDERTNLGMNEMKMAVEDFGRNIKEGGVGLFYYAGHGMQVNGRNYLIPVDADIQGEAEVDYKAVDAGLVLAKMDMAKNGMNIVILDACRNNPFARSFRAANLGLASMNAPSGTLIAYATAPGSVASDGTGANGLYTQEVVKAIRKPGVKIEDAFKQVRTSVKQQTNEKQIPWEASSLEGDFYFAGKPEGGIDISRLQGLVEGSKERQQELERLMKLEAEASAQKAKEQAEIAKKEKELADLDAQIAAMKGKLGTSAAGPNDSLQAMVAMVEKKEADARNIEELKKQREIEEIKRQAEIEQLKVDAAENRLAELENDLTAYDKIVNSPYGKDMVPLAWQSLVTKYVEAHGVKIGDSKALRKKLAVPDVDPITGMRFVLVKGDCYQMGDIFGESSDKDERPVHKVCLDDFYMSKFEVTQAQWKKVMGDNPSFFDKCGENCPVDRVSWDRVQEFIRKLNSQTSMNYRLPTEAEWEYAARSGGKSERWAGTSKESELGYYAWYSGNSEMHESRAWREIHPVGQKLPNGLGLYDMSGNVSEWCQDWIDERYYDESPKWNPQGTTRNQTSRVKRGGGVYRSADLRTTGRSNGFPYEGSPMTGFRLVRAAK